MITFAVLGYGGRGKNYAMTAKSMPTKFKLTSVCEINKEKLAVAKLLHHLNDNMLFDSDEKFFEAGKLADYLFICTQDKDHYEHAMKALELGYDLLLEKPITPSIEETVKIEQRALELGRKIVVCHVLRYTAFYEKIKETMDSGILGDIIAVEMKENVGYWHQAHSFVRGDWANSKDSCPMILAKCCHDLDIAVYLTGSECERVSAIGKLHHFKPENAPAGSTLRCLDGCKAKKDCPYDCEKIYIDGLKKVPRNARKGAWPQSRVVPSGIVSVDALYKELKTGDFGRCVYHCDNDVVDYQVTQMLFKNGINCTLTMTAFSNIIDREIRVRGTKGELIGDMEEKILYYVEYGKKKKKISLAKVGGLSGHGGGDVGMMEGLANGNAKSTITESIQSHLMAAASEYSRINGGISVNIDEFKAQQLNK